MRSRAPIRLRAFRRPSAHWPSPTSRRRPSTTTSSFRRRRGAISAFIRRAISGRPPPKPRRRASAEAAGARRRQRPAVARPKCDTIAPHARADFAAGGIGPHFEGNDMARIVRSVLALTLALAVAACAAPPPPAPRQAPPPPPKHKLDAKTQLETGRTYERRRLERAAGDRPRVVSLVKMGNETPGVDRRLEQPHATIREIGANAIGSRCRTGRQRLVETEVLGDRLVRSERPCGLYHIVSPGLNGYRRRAGGDFLHRVGTVDTCFPAGVAPATLTSAPEMGNAYSASLIVPVSAARGPDESEVLGQDGPPSGTETGVGPARSKPLAATAMTAGPGLSCSRA